MIPRGVLATSSTPGDASMTTGVKGGSILPVLTDPKRVTHPSARPEPQRTTLSYPNIPTMLTGVPTHVPSRFLVLRRIVFWRMNRSTSADAVEYFSLLSMCTPPPFCTSKAGKETVCSI